MNKIKGAIFDADGTLLDSMRYCNDISVRYLKNLGINNIEKNLSEKMFSMTFDEGSKYLSENYKINKNPETIKKEILSSLEDFYINVVDLKKGVREVLEYLKNNNIKMLIGTSSDEYLIKKACKRLDISKYFLDILTPENTGYSKKEKEFFEICLDKLKSKSSETCLFEDGLYSIIVANTLNIKTVAVKDDTNFKYVLQLKENADIYLEDISKIKEIL